MPFTEYTSDDVIARLRIYDFSTGSQTQLEPTDLLKVADDVIKSEIVPVLITLNENFYVTRLEANFVVNQSEYALPQFAMYNMISNAKFVNSTGQEFDINPVPINRSIVRNYTLAGQPSEYYLENKTISFFPPPASALDKYRIFYFRRPAFLTLSANVAIITAVNKATGLVTYASLPAAGFTATSVHDFYSSNSPFVRLGDAITATAQAGVTQTFPVASVQNLSIGDAVSVTGYCHIPDIPVELQLLLVQLMKSKVATSQTDQTKYAMTQDQVEKKMASLLYVPGNRLANQAVSLNVNNSPLLSGYRW